jgi:hypothetical protein
MKSPADFASIDDEKKRSKAIFKEMGAVLTHPRCVNCHTTGDEPLQGEEGLAHQPMVVRGEAGMGRPGMRCGTCHGNSNFRNMPGFAGWRMAPRRLGWEGRSIGDICETLKSTGGGQNLEPVVSFIKNSNIVAYGWSPPKNYDEVPGRRDLFGELAEAWVDSGAHCPEESDAK